MIGPDFHLAVLHGVLVIDHEGEALRLIAANGLVREQQCLVLATPWQTGARKEAWDERQVGVREDGPPSHRAGVRVKPIIDEIEVALVRKSRFIRQPQRDGGFRLAGRGAPVTVTVPPEARVFEIGALIHLEIAVDRVERDDAWSATWNPPSPPLIRLPSVTM